MSERITKNIISFISVDKKSELIYNSVADKIKVKGEGKISLSNWISPNIRDEKNKISYFTFIDLIRGLPYRCYVAICRFDRGYKCVTEQLEEIN